MFIRQFLKQFVLTKEIYKFLHNMRIEFYHRNFLKKARKTIVELENLMSKTCFFYFFDMGTLLGIIRNGDILSHDKDIDIGCIINNIDDIDNISNYLMNNYCKKICTLSVEDIGVVEESFLLNGIKFDVNYYYPKENGYDYCYLLYSTEGKKYNEGIMDVVELKCPHISSKERVKIFDSFISVPKKPLDYLRVRYGENWSIPDKNYIYYKGPSACQIDKLGYIKEY